MIDYESYKRIKTIINKEVSTLKDSLAYSVDNLNQFWYIKGKLQGLETLLQDLTDLQNKQELFDDDTDRKSGST